MSRIFSIAAGHYRGKHIHVAKYEKTARGLDITITHNLVAPVGKQLQWVQTVSSNHGFSIDCKMLTRVDPFGTGGAVNTVPLPAVPGICRADDLLPFYWTAADLAAGRGPGLSDSPSVPVPGAGRTWTQFVTALTEVAGTTVHHLIAIHWGYDLMADGSLKVAPVRTPTEAEMRAHGAALKRMYPTYRYN